MRNAFSKEANLIGRRLTFAFPCLALILSGCFPPFVRQAPQPLPPAFPSPPTLEQLIGTVNANASRISSLESRATIRVMGVSLKGDLAVEQPRRFRIRAKFMGLPGTGIDIGSNDETFWMFTEQNRPPGVYVVRHDQFAQSSANQFLPVSGDWLIDALGVVDLEPGGEHNGPYQRVPGKIEIHTRLPSASGDLTKITVIDERYGWVLEQQIIDQGQVVASSVASQHRFYPEHGVSLPQHVDIQIISKLLSKQALSIDLGPYRINQLAGNRDQLWAIPQPEGIPIIDLASPQLTQQLTPTVGSRPAPEVNQLYRDPRETYRPSFRGGLR